MDNARAPRRNVGLLFLRRPRDKDIIRFNGPFSLFQNQLVIINVCEVEQEVFNNNNDLSCFNNDLLYTIY